MANGMSTELKVLISSNEEKEEYYREKPWAVTPNTFLARVVKYLFPQDTNLIVAVTEYLSIEKKPRTKENFYEFKNLEKTLMHRAVTECKNENQNQNTQ